MRLSLAGLLGICSAYFLTFPASEHKSPGLYRIRNHNWLLFRARGNIANSLGRKLWQAHAPTPIDPTTQGAFTGRKIRMISLRPRISLRSGTQRAEDCFNRCRSPGVLASGFFVATLLRQIRARWRKTKQDSTRRDYLRRQVLYTPVSSLGD